MKKFILVCICLLSLVKLSWGDDMIPQKLEEIFINNFVYVSDKNQFGVDEYYQTPEEFAKTFRGDCEDAAIFTHVYLKAYNYEAYMYAIIFEDSGHAVTVFKQFGYYNSFDNGKIFYTKKTNPVEAVIYLYPDYELIVRFLPTKFGHIKALDNSFIDNIIKINLFNIIKHNFLTMIK